MSDQETPAPRCQPISQEDFYKRHAKSLRSFFRRQGVAPADVEELAHDAFVRAFGAWNDVRCASWTWLSMVATNVWKNDLRRRHARKRAGVVVELDATSEPAQAAQADDPVEKLAREKQMKALVQAAVSLPPRMRECLMLHVQQDMTMRAIAERLGITEGAVKAQIHEARKRLKRQLGPLDSPPSHS
jgi:RNA polymerase sigma-70 factor (ECF subfamily)